MNIRNLKSWDKDDVLDLIGLQSRRTAVDWILPSLGLFGAGLVVGAGLGMLLAPKSGRELREDLRLRIQSGQEGLQQTYPPVTSGSSDRPSASRTF
jgi:hypothetical protein